jgi:hypothetical protein
MELWPQWVYPVISILAIIGILGGTFTKRLKVGWRRLLLRVAGVIFSIPFALFTLVSVFMIGCQFDGPLIGSPDRRHVARVQVSAPLGAVVQPLASVAVRRSWHPTSKNAYIGFGYKRQDGTFEPKVKWIDNSHLLITFPDGSEDPISCHQTVGDVLVKCEVEEMSK